MPILLVGAGDSAELFLRDISRTDSNYRVVGIVSGTPSRVGRVIHGVEILGTIDCIPEVVESLGRRGAKPQRLVVTSERIESTRMRDLFEIAENLGLTVARLPSLSDFRSDVSAEMVVKPIDVEDLLGRPQTSLDPASVSNLISGRRILVTGAGGSIGSELVRQLAKLSPSHLILLDSSEYNLFKIDLEISNSFSRLPRSALISDVRDPNRVKEIFRQVTPEIVFHAAALKHVPMVETNVLEGISTNVFGTRNIADAARAAEVHTFVQISTDKAVNPTNVMGATKRLAEVYCQALDLDDEVGEIQHSLPSGLATCSDQQGP